MILKKDGLRVNVTNEVQADAYLSSGWTKVLPILKEEKEPDKKKSNKGGKKVRRYG